MGIFYPKKLGPVLFQFPHTWRLNLDRLGGFMAELRRYRGQQFAFEFRDKSWLCEDVFHVLEEAGAALCLPVHPEMPVELRLTARWTYIRFHTGKYGTGFTDAELHPWSERIRSWQGEGVGVYVYFNNDPGGHALNDARRLREILE
jgi:uncharacterized protein YecE (DUF72 family)